MWKTSHENISSDTNDLLFSNRGATTAISKCRFYRSCGNFWKEQYHITKDKVLYSTFVRVSQEKRKKNVFTDQRRCRRVQHNLPFASCVSYAQWETSQISFNSPQPIHPAIDSYRGSIHCIVFQFFALIHWLDFVLNTVSSSSSLCKDRSSGYNEQGEGWGRVSQELVLVFDCRN